MCDVIERMVYCIQGQDGKQYQIGKFRYIQVIIIIKVVHNWR